MGNHSKARPLPEPPGVLYWLYRALLCLMIAPLIGALVGLVGVFAGMLMGELAAAAVLVLFMADLFFRMVRARRMQAAHADPSAQLWDPDFDE
jgi:hypothetical protein